MLSTVQKNNKIEDKYKDNLFKFNNLKSNLKDKIDQIDNILSDKTNNINIVLNKIFLFYVKYFIQNKDYIKSIIDKFDETKELYIKLIDDYDENDIKLIDEYIFIIDNIHTYTDSELLEYIDDNILSSIKYSEYELLLNNILYKFLLQIVITIINSLSKITEIHDRSHLIELENIYNIFIYDENISDKINKSDMPYLLSFYEKYILNNIHIMLSSPIINEGYKKHLNVLDLILSTIYYGEVTDFFKEYNKSKYFILNLLINKFKKFDIKISKIYSILKFINIIICIYK